MYLLRHVVLSCYRIEFRKREEWRHIKYAFRARDADPEEREEIADKKGVRWSALDVLGGWFSAKNSPLEFMHAMFLGKNNHVIQKIIVGGGMLNAKSKHDKPKEKFNAFLQSIEWPGSVGRVPKKVRIIAVLYIVLYVA